MLCRIIVIFEEDKHLPLICVLCKSCSYEVWKMEIMLRENFKLFCVLWYVVRLVLVQCHSFFQVYIIWHNIIINNDMTNRSWLPLNTSLLLPTPHILLHGTVPNPITFFSRAIYAGHAITHCIIWHSRATDPCLMSRILILLLTSNSDTIL